MENTTIEIKSDLAIVPDQTTTTPTPDLNQDQVKKPIIMNLRARPEYILNVLKTLNQFHTEIGLMFDIGGISIKSMDPANVEMSIVEIYSSGFVEYRISEPFKIYVNIKALTDILKTTTKKDLIEFKYNSEDPAKLKINVINGITKSYVMPLIESEEKEQKIPDLTFKVMVKVTSELFIDAIKALKAVSESITFNVMPDKLMLKAESDLNKLSLDLWAEGINNPENEICKYSSEYLLHLIKNKGLFKEISSIKIEYAKEYPLRITINKIDHFKFIMILAPRVETN